MTRSAPRPRPLTAPTPGDDGAYLRTVPVTDIIPSPANTRLFDVADPGDHTTLADLAASIKEVGLQQPPKVRPNPGGTPPWVLIYGERRLRAARDLLGWATITVLVDEGVTEAVATEAMVVENMQRRDLHPMDEARSLSALRAQGFSVKRIAARLGRRPDWIKERLTLCALPTEAQDLYRRSEQMTLGQALSLHQYTHGGKDNAGFPSLIVALATEMAGGQSGAAALSSLVPRHPDLLIPVQHAYSATGGRWGGNFFDTRSLCTQCPFAAYRPGYYEGVGYCLLPTHYADLKAKGEAVYEEAQAAALAANPERTPVLSDGWMPTPVKSAAQKGKETKTRHHAQRASYAATVAAIERVVDMIANLDGIDIATLCAYVLTVRNVHDDALQQVVARHDLSGFPRLESTPSRQQMERLRLVAPVDLVRYTLEALLLTQAERARDYDPGRTPADPVLALYLPHHAEETAIPVADDATEENELESDGEVANDND